ncbi:MAG TPA: hypothetical protein VGN17_26035 [Bryobacteraceae bacterium]|jgi:hypothetical protein
MADNWIQDDLVVDTPDFTAADLTAINKAIALGALEVRFADRTIRYASITDLLTARQVIKSYLDAQNATVRTRQTRLYTEGGW